MEEEEEYWVDAEEYDQQYATADSDTVAYYDATADPAWDVDEYDEVLAVYSDARKRMNELRLSRGFYPVVAMVGEPSSASAGRKGTGKKGGKLRL